MCSYKDLGVDMAHPMGEREAGVLRLDFDRRLKLEFHGSKVTRCGVSSNASEIRQPVKSRVSQKVRTGRSAVSAVLRKASRSSSVR